MQLPIARLGQVSSMSQYFMKAKIMHHHLIPLIWVVLLFVATPLSAKDVDTSGVQLYQQSVLAAKQSVRIEKVAAQLFDEKELLRISQSAIGNQLGDYTFVNQSGRVVRLSDFRGKPLVIDMIYTHCPIVCATKTRNLEVLKLSQEALGVDSFSVLTIGFDTDNDTPEEMDKYAKRMDAKLTNWEFVSADVDTIKKLSKDVGFVFTQSPNGGFDHISQTTFVDGQGKVYQQIYGDEFNNQTLLIPLKNMIFNVKTTDPIYNFETAESGLAGISNSIKLFCTVYDARSGKYIVDYSIFYAMGLSIFVSLLIIWWIIFEYRRSPKRSHL